MSHFQHWVQSNTFCSHSFSYFCLCYISAEFIWICFILLYNHRSLCKHASWMDGCDHWIFRDNNYEASGCRASLPANSSLGVAAPIFSGWPVFWVGSAAFTGPLITKLLISVPHFGLHHCLYAGNCAKRRVGATWFANPSATSYKDFVI